MTNQEIFNDLGEMGTLMLLFLEMAGADGEFDESEIETIIDGASNFTDKNLVPFIDSALAIRKAISVEARINYLAAGLGYFAGNLSADMKKGILVELAKIAKADGVIHDNESALFKMAASYLNA
jgi:uncharacterized tellurite resistance protein B-like protein